MDELFPSQVPAALPRDAEEQWRDEERVAPRPTAVFAGVAVSAAAHLTFSVLGIALAASAASARAGGAAVGVSNAARGAICLLSLAASLFAGAAVAGVGTRDRSRAAGLAEGAIVWSVSALLLFLAMSAGFDAVAGFDPRGAGEAVRALGGGPDVEPAGQGAQGIVTIVRGMTRAGRWSVTAMLVLTSLASVAGARCGARLRGRRARVRRRAA